MKGPIPALVAGSFVIGVAVGTFAVAPFFQSRPAPQPVTSRAPSPNDGFAEAVAAGNRAMDEKKYDRAVEAYDRALAVRFDSDVATDRGVCLRMMGDRDRALTTFEFILMRDPAHWQARYNRAVVLLELGRIEEARADVETLMTQQPVDPGVMQLRKAIETASAKQR